ncbi:MULTISPECIES: MFS transporter [Paraburkholderia]|uniref:MFS transporter n=1 Tax=Paraburkholderia TaxID=1822464 RepID=UPI000360C203|nr:MULTISPECIES: MFS transporter [Paraburkholderia]MDH6147551.1 ACS family tartrate transporter-like MFS transporter [Paraburkholderia sp. WSM4179]
MNAEEQRTYRLVAVRILPVLFIAHFLLQFDRINVGFAALQMNTALRFGPETFGLGVGIFFVGYALFEIPSNLLLHRMGAPLWIARIMVTWGLLSCAMAFVSNATTFYLLRFFLGVAEAGFTPGVLYYVSLWFTRRSLSSANGVWSAASPLAGVLVGPVSGLLLSVHMLGIEGWRWMFVVEGVPTVVFGCFLYWMLPRGVEHASWLPDASRQFLMAELAHERSTTSRPQETQFLRSLKSFKVWVYALTYFALLSGIYALFFWLPQIVKASAAHLSNASIGWISALPFLFGVVLLLTVPQFSDRTGDRRWHLVVLAALAGASLYASTIAANPVLAYAAIVVAVGSSFCYMAIFWNGPAAALSGAAAAGGFALINSVGNIGGFLGPYTFGLMRGATGSFSAGLAWFSAFFAVAAIVPLVLPKRFPAGRSETRPRPDATDHAVSAMRHSSRLDPLNGEVHDH